MHRLYVIVIFVLFVFVISVGQQITYGEYFFNTDPGYGNGTLLKFENENELVSINTTLSIPESLPEGFNTIYFRFRDEYGSWSLVCPHIFLKNSHSNVEESITYIEYFIDRDPGFGKGISLNLNNVSQNVEIDYTIELSNLQAGFHNLFIRAKNNFGEWSIVKSSTFYLEENGLFSNIRHLNYYFKNQHFTSDTFTYTLPTPQPAADLNFEADISSLPLDTIYELIIEAVNEKGQSSLVEKRTFKACSKDSVVADFDFIVVGNRVSFMDLSSNSDKYYWDYGDDLSDTISNPIHSFSSLGTHLVTMISTNFCTSDTLLEQIHLLGINKIVPSKSGNNGSVSVNIIGAGFTTDTKVRLERNGISLMSDSIFVSSNSNSLTTTFLFENSELGVYDLIVETNSSSDTLSRSFTIEENNQQNVSFDLIGRKNIRIGRLQQYELQYSNNSNIDVYMLPVTIEIPKSVNLEFNGEIGNFIDLIELPSEYPPDSIPLIIETESSKLVPLIIPFIPAYFSGSIDFKIFATADQIFEINIIQSPLLVNPENIFERTNFQDGNLKNSNYDCTISFLNFIVSGSKVIVGDGCINALSDALILLTIVWDEDGVFSNQNGNLNDANIVTFRSSSLFAALASIAGDAGLCIVGDSNPYLGPVLRISSFIDALNFGAETVRNCFPKYASRLQISPVRSIDPNEKVGPITITDINHIKSNIEINYKVFFENLDSATADVQEIVISDTLDLNTLDISTFKLEEITIGNKYKIIPPPGLIEYSTLIDLRPSQNLLVRIDAFLDEINGIVNWHFMSLDPKTMELTDDPLAGFLPPNITSPEGEGHVSYSISPKLNQATGTEIKNRASIKFDFNEAIITEDFINTIDDELPVSSVLELDPVQSDSIFTVAWEGMDSESGVSSYDVYVSTNNGPFKLWLYDVSYTTDSLIGKVDSTYSLFSIAKDNAGNIENLKTKAESSTHISFSTATKNIESDHESVKVFPNPANCCFSISINKENFSECSIEVINLLGQKEFHQTISSRSAELDLSMLPKGSYILLFHFEDNSITKKVILQ